MIEVNKRLRGYIASLFLLGLLALTLGLMFSLTLFKYPENINILTFPFGVVGAIAGFLLISIPAGGYVNFYLSKHNPNQDEKKLYELIAKYKNKFLISGVALCFIITYLAINFINRSHQIRFSLDDIFGSFALTFLCTMLLSTGIKYLSAWWNIRKRVKNNIFTLTYIIGLLVSAFLLLFFLNGFGII